MCGIAENISPCSWGILRRQGDFFIIRAGFTRKVNLLGQSRRNRPAKFARTSLSAWGLPTPVVALACIGNVDIQVFFWYKWVTLFCTAFASLHSLGGGGVHPYSVLSSAATPKPSGGIRSLPSLSAWGLPTPVVALACIGNVDIQVLSGAGG